MSGLTYSMAIDDDLQRIIDEYPVTVLQPFADNPLANLIRREIPKSLEALCDNPDNRYRFIGSPGQGTWARSPWVAVLDTLVTTTVQRGYYPVYLFREDFTGFYLSLNQGVTTVREQYKTGAREALHIRASDFRAQLDATAERFPLKKIELHPASGSRLSPDYEAGNIRAKFYKAGEIPPERELIEDLSAMLDLYDALTYGDTSTLAIAPEGDEPSLDFEDLRRVRLHSRVERNQRLAKKVKALKGYKCEACNFDYEEIYGELGKGYIEAHHLTPISQLKNQVVQMDPQRDFAVLCASCHRMIHRYTRPDDLEGFRSLINPLA
jgi:5-methylcytosine-specific restriction protein A